MHIATGCDREREREVGMGTLLLCNLAIGYSAKMRLKTYIWLQWFRSACLCILLKLWPMFGTQSTKFDTESIPLSMVMVCGRGQSQDWNKLLLFWPTCNKQKQAP